MALKYQLIEELGSVKARVSNYPEKYKNQRAERIFDLVQDCQKDINSPQEGIVLDYGGQSGVNLKYFDKSNYDCQVLDYEEWEMPGNVTYAGQTLADLEIKPNVILCNHTLEHVVDPLLFVKEIVDVMGDDSLLYIEVPLGAFYREYKKVMDVEPLTHVNFFSEQSLKEVCDKAGLNTVYLKTEYQQLQTVKYWCINIVATKKTVDQEIKPLSTEEQLKKKPFYFGQMAVNRVIRRIKMKLT